MSDGGSTPGEKNRPPTPIHTIGHSTRSADELIGLLKGARVDLLVDIRTVPRSRTNPQFNADALPAALAAAGIGYRHLAALGGLRGRQRLEGPSPNAYWRVGGFRNYADYAMAPAFREGLDELLALGRRHACAIMCAEAPWWRCHRRIVTDYLLAEGVPMKHILGPGRIEPARMTPAAVRRKDGVLCYPGVEDPLP